MAHIGFCMGKHEGDLLCKASVFLYRFIGECGEIWSGVF